MAQDNDVQLIGGVSELADRYDGFLVDLWGCVHNGIEPFPAAVDALLRLAEAGKTICLLSNGPRRASDLVARLDQMGVPRAAYHHVMSSGEAAWQALAERPDAFHAAFGARCYHLGPARDRSVIEGNGTVPAVSIEQADFILNTGPVDFADSLESYEAVLQDALRLDLPMVCANPDLVVHIGDDLVICAGLIAQRFEALGGRVAYHGKPYRSVYDRCFAFMETIASSRILAIGDGLRTDILGAGKQGMDSLFLTAGIHIDEVSGDSPDISLIRALSESIGTVPPYAMPRLSW